MIDKGSAERDPQFLRFWREATPANERSVIAMAPRGTALTDSSYGGDIGTTLVGVLLEVVVSRIRANGSWKVGVFHAGAPRWRRRAHRSAGSSEREAEQEVARHRSSVRRGTIVRD